MSPVVAITVLICAVIGGWLGWRRATRPPSRRSLLGAARSGGGRRGKWTFIVTMIYALGGAVIGFLVLAIWPQAAGAAMVEIPK